MKDNNETDKEKIEINFLKDYFNKNKEDITLKDKKNIIYSEFDLIKKDFDRLPVNNFIDYLNQLIVAYKKNFKEGELEKHICNKENDKSDFKSIDKILMNFNKDLEIASKKHKQNIKKHEDLLDGLSDEDELKTIFVASKTLKDIHYVKLLYSYILEDLKNSSSVNFKYLYKLVLKIESTILKDLNFINENFDDLTESFLLKSGMSFNNSDDQVDDDLDGYDFDEDDNTYLAYDYDYIEDLEEIYLDITDFNKFEKYLKAVSNEYDMNREKFLDLRNAFDERILLERGTNEEIETKTIPIVKESLEDIEDLIDEYNVFLTDKDKISIGLKKEIERVLSNLNMIYTELLTFFEKLNQEYFGYYDEVERFFINIYASFEKFDKFTVSDVPENLKNNHKNLDDNEINEHLDSNEVCSDDEKKEVIITIKTVSKEFNEIIKNYFEDKKRNEPFKKHAIDDLKDASKIREIDFDMIKKPSLDYIETCDNLELGIKSILILIKSLKSTYKKSSKERKILKNYIISSKKVMDISKDIKIEINDFLSELKKLEK
ncbi:MAG: hypothetical protein LBT66_03045 [Methanobrevibacter sp.]|jgi:hypothetical protein|nr:hypothetical protein [Candidatus Methanovirga meridionalis]